MSKIRLHGSSSGYTEIAPVAASGNNTLTLPNDGTIISQDSNGAVGVTSITVGTGVTIGDGRVTCTTLHGSAASLTAIPAANIVGLATAGFNRSGGFPEGVTMADSWRITEDFTNNSQPISSNWERGDVSPWEGYMGSSGLTESSGVFTFPSTGWYYVHYSHDFRTSSDVNWVYMGLELTNDSGSNWTNLSYAAGNNGYGDGDTTYHLSCQTSIFDVTNVSTQKMRFYVERQTGTVITQGNSNRKQTGFDIFRLGDT